MSTALTVLAAVVATLLRDIGSRPASAEETAARKSGIRPETVRAVLWIEEGEDE